jgi:hypothetical protein
MATSATYDFAITRDRYDDKIELSAMFTPAIAGSTLVFSQSVVTSSATTLTATVPSNTSPGSYTILVTAKAPGFPLSQFQIAFLLTNLGQATMSKSVAVVLASDQPPFTTYGTRQVPSTYTRDILGTPRVGDTQLLFSDINLYGIDPEEWIPYTGGAIRSGDNPDTVLWNTLYGMNATYNLSVSVAFDEKASSTKLKIEPTIIPGFINYLLQENGSRALLEDGLGFVLVNSRPTTTFQSFQRAALLTIRKFKYVPGSILNCSFGIRAETGSINCTKEWGLFDEFDGYFFRLVGNRLNIVKRTSVTETTVETVIPSSSWNIDKLDGSGLSGWTIDPNLVTMYRIDLGVDGIGAKFYAYLPYGGRPEFSSDVISAQNFLTLHIPDGTVARTPENQAEPVWVAVHYFSGEDNLTTATFSNIYLPLQFNLLFNGTPTATESLEKYGCSVGLAVSSNNFQDPTLINSVESILPWGRSTAPYPVFNYLQDSDADNVVFSLYVGGSVTTNQPFTILGAIDYLLQENGSRILLEDGSGYIISKKNPSTISQVVTNLGFIDYLLQENGSRLLLEDGSGYIILNSSAATTSQTKTKINSRSCYPLSLTLSSNSLCLIRLLKNAKTGNRGYLPDYQKVSDGSGVFIDTTETRRITDPGKEIASFIVGPRNPLKIDLTEYFNPLKEYLQYSYLLTKTFANQTPQLQTLRSDFFYVSARPLDREFTLYHPLPVAWDTLYGMTASLHGRTTSSESTNTESNITAAQLWVIGHIPYSSTPLPTYDASSGSFDENSAAFFLLLHIPAIGSANMKPYPANAPRIFAELTFGEY